jgi:hypothetical protein
VRRRLIAQSLGGRIAGTMRDVVIEPYREPL